jgi:hypothetical protein
MKQVLQEEWDKITIEEINTEIAKLPTIMRRCIDCHGDARTWKDQEAHESE